jgi:prepilin-type N-terminal cleavage/methylation domain-containing protein
MGKKAFTVHRAGFTIVELLVVIGIMTILTGILLPALNRAQQASKAIKCQAQLHDIGLALLEYADEHNGYLFPSDMGYDSRHVGPVYPDDGSDPNEVYNVWPLKVWGKWNPPEMVCPADILPAAQHSYVINSHMAYWNLKYSSVLPNHVSPSDVVLMGEKYSVILDYYMEPDQGDFDRVVDTAKHGSQWGSNYLMLDMHVDTKLSKAAEEGLDPWDFEAGRNPPTTQQSPTS